MRALIRRITKLEDRRGLTEPVKIIHLPPSKPPPVFVTRPDGSTGMQVTGADGTTREVTLGVVVHNGR